MKTLHKIIESCKNAPPLVKLVLLAGLGLMLLYPPAATEICLGWKSAYALLAITLAAFLVNDLFQWILGRVPARRFKALEARIRECLSIAESRVDFDLDDEIEQDVDGTYDEFLNRSKLFNELSSLGITLPDGSEAKDVVRFLTHMALYSQKGALCEAREFSEDLRSGKLSFER